jgi:CRP-like cAMP-binding protein
MMQRLIDEIRSIADVSDTEVAAFIESMEAVTVPKGDYFLKEGQVSRRMGYIERGLMMHYQIHDGNECPTGFTKEHEWVAYLKSFTTGSPSDTSIRALEDTELLVLTGESMAKVFELQPKFMAVRSFYTDQFLVRTVEYLSDLANMKARDRYHKFVEQNPDLQNRIPQYLIAAYLGMKPQSLSRLRGQRQ